jgi:hypothetical protein
MDMPIEKEDLKTLVACTNRLNELGFTTQFIAQDNGLKSMGTARIYFPDEVEIVNFFRFEGESDPEDSAILYAIQINNGERGTLTDAYGMYSDNQVAEFVKQVNSIKKRV